MHISRTPAAVAAAALVVPALALGALPSAHAATTYSWTGEGDGNSWSDADNWSPNGVPDTADEDATLPDGARVTSDKPVTIGKLRMEGDAHLESDGGGMTTRAFEFLGGLLNMKVATGAFTASGDAEKTVNYQGSIDATLTTGGTAGTADVQSGTLQLDGDKEQLKVRSQLKIGGRLSGYGGATIVTIQETGCSASLPCGIVVTAADSYGAAIEGVQIAATKVSFDASSTDDVLSMRDSTWAPKTPATITGGTLETGPGYPDGIIGNTDVEVKLPATVTLDNATWSHVSGEILANTTLNPGAGASGEFSWKGGSLVGKLTTAKSGANEVTTRLEGSPDDELWLKNPSKAGSLLTLNGATEIVAGTTLLVGSASSVDNKGALTQQTGTVIRLDGSGKTAKVSNSGTWSLAGEDLLGEEPPTISDIPFVSTGSLNIGTQNLRLDYASSSLAGKTAVTVDSAEKFGSIQLVDSASLKMGGELIITTSPSAALESGDDLLIVDNSDGSPTNLSGDFAPVTGTTISPTLGYRAAISADGYSLSVGGQEPMTLTGKSATKVKAKKPLLITYTVTSQASGPVTPTLQLPMLKGAVISTPDELACEEGATMDCELPEMEPGASETVEVYYTFAKTGKATITSKVVTAGFNPNPANAISSIKVTITR